MNPELSEDGRRLIRIHHTYLFTPSDENLAQDWPAIPVLIIPHYANPDYLERCVDSIDYPVHKLVIIQAGPDKWYPKISRPYLHIRLPGAGFALNVNLGVKLFPAPWWLICSNDIEFSPGDLKRMAIAATMHGENYSMICGNHFTAWWIWTPRGVEKVGLYDENFHPFYCEDADWQHRRSLLKEGLLLVAGVHSKHGASRRLGATVGNTIERNPELKPLNKASHDGNMAYYIQKWGGINGAEQFETPFNAGVPIDYWHYSPEFRAIQHWGEL